MVHRKDKKKERNSEGEKKIESLNYEPSSFLSEQLQRSVADSLKPLFIDAIFFAPFFLLRGSGAVAQRTALKHFAIFFAPPQRKLDIYPFQSSFHLFQRSGADLDLGSLYFVLEKKAEIFFSPFPAERTGHLPFFLFSFPAQRSGAFALCIFSLAQRCLRPRSGDFQPSLAPRWLPRLIELCLCTLSMRKSSIIL